MSLQQLHCHGVHHRFREVVAIPECASGLLCRSVSVLFGPSLQQCSRLPSIDPSIKPPIHPSLVRSSSIGWPGRHGRPPWYHPAPSVRSAMPAARPPFWSSVRPADPDSQSAIRLPPPPAALVVRHAAGRPIPPASIRLQLTGHQHDDVRSQPSASVAARHRPSIHRSSTDQPLAIQPASHPADPPRGRPSACRRRSRAHATAS